MIHHPPTPPPRSTCLAKLVPVSDVPLTTSIAYVLREAGGQFYTGKAGEGWISTDLSKAFQYNNLDVARNRAKHFNAFAAMHGQYFIVLALTD